MRKSASEWAPLKKSTIDIPPLKKSTGEISLMKDTGDLPPTSKSADYVFHIASHEEENWELLMRKSTDDVSHIKKGNGDEVTPMNSSDDFPPIKKSTGGVPPMKSSDDFPPMKKSIGEVPPMKSPDDFPPMKKTTGDVPLINECATDYCNEAVHQQTICDHHKHIEHLIIIVRFSRNIFYSPN